MRVALAACAVLLASGLGDPAAAFDLRFDRAAFDGNAFGPSDGTFDLVDEFNDGVLAPAFAQYSSIVFESGGFLHCTESGGTIGINGTQHYLANARTTQTLSDGLGNLTADATLPAGLPGPEESLSIALWNETTREIISAGITNVTALGGLGLVQSAGQQVGSELTTTDQIQPLDSGDVTGPIVLRLLYDDTANTVQAAFSIDGGTVFTAPFAAVPIPTPLSNFVLLSGFVPVAFVPTTSTSSTSTSSSSTVPSTSSTSTLPAPFDCTGPSVTAQRGSLFHGSQQTYFDDAATVRARIPLPLAPFDGVAEGAEVSFLADVGNSLSQYIDLHGPNAVPPGALGTGCHPRDGWRQTARAFIYRNVSGLRPPGCSIEMPRTTLRIVSRRDGTLAVRAKVTPTGGSGNVDGEARMAIVLGQGPGPIAAGRCATGTLTCVSTPSAVRCNEP